MLPCIVADNAADGIKNRCDGPPGLSWIAWVLMQGAPPVPYTPSANGVLAKTGPFAFGMLLAARALL